MLDWLEETRATITYFLDESSQYVVYEQGGPATYDTLQEALVAFLIYEVSKKGKGLVTSSFPFGYATWLRTVVLIVADVQRDRMLLTVTVPTDYTGKASQAATHRRDHTMTLGDNWDCLSRDTFNAIRQAFSRSG